MTPITGLVLAGAGLSLACGAAVSSQSSASSAGTPGAPAASAAAVTNFVRWTEPKERAFSIEVPEGWSVDGGVNWLGPTDPQSFVRVQSPDGKIRAFFGDPELLSRQVPTPMGRIQAGVAEGQIFRTGTGGTAKLEAYATGAAYAKQHAAWRLCPNPTFVRSEEQPDVSRTMAAAIAPELRKWNIAAGVSASAGESTFTCGAEQGAVFATTILVGEGGPIQLWTVYRVAGFITSDPLRSMDARYVMEHMLATFAADAAWQEQVDRRAMQMTGAAISMQNAATQSALAASRQQNETLARLNHPNTFSPSSAARASSSAAGSTRPDGTGNVRLCDAIGRCTTVSDTAESYFMDHSGNVRAGRAGSAPPDDTGVWSRLYR